MTDPKLEIKNNLKDLLNYRDATWTLFIHIILIHKVLWIPDYVWNKCNIFLSEPSAIYKNKTFKCFYNTLKAYFYKIMRDYNWMGN